MIKLKIIMLSNVSQIREVFQSYMYNLKETTLMNESKRKTKDMKERKWRKGKVRITEKLI